MRTDITGLALVLGLAACGAACAARPFTDVTSLRARDGTPQGLVGGSPIPNDVALVREIRAKIIDSTMFSADAQNVDVSAENGVVTLSGSVETEQEKAAIVAIARDAPGVARVRERLEVAKR